jgi:hypothetical protein
MKSLKTFEFPEEGTGTRASYDWEKLLDGKIYQLEEGKDYQCKTTTFATLARGAAKRAGKGVKVAKVEGGIVIQAVKGEAPAPEEKE